MPLFLNIIKKMINPKTTEDTTFLIPLIKNNHHSNPPQARGRRPSTKVAPGIPSRLLPENRIIAKATEDATLLSSTKKNNQVTEGATLLISTIMTNWRCSTPRKPEGGDFTSKLPEDQPVQPSHDKNNHRGCHPPRTQFSKFARAFPKNQVTAKIIDGIKNNQHCNPLRSSRAVSVREGGAWNFTSKLPENQTILPSHHENNNHHKK